MCGAGARQQAAPGAVQTTQCVPPDWQCAGWRDSSAREDSKHGWQDTLAEWVSRIQQTRTSIVLARMAQFEDSCTRSHVQVNPYYADPLVLG